MNYEDKACQMEPKLQKENPLYELMRSYVQAKEAFDSACQTYATAHQRRESAEKTLLGLSEKVTQAVQQGVYDPTTPQHPQPNAIDNGLALGFSGAPRY